MADEGQELRAAAKGLSEHMALMADKWERQIALLAESNAELREVNRKLNQDNVQLHRDLDEQTKRMDALEQKTEELRAQNAAIERALREYEQKT